MLKITAFLALVFVVSCVWSAGLSCGSCGPECTSSCGTRRFRACCFNYLRRKRGAEGLKVHFLNEDQKQNLPYYFEKMPSEDQWIDSILSNENHPYRFENRVENHLNED